MINYKELSAKFTEELSRFDADSLSAWMEYDYQREVLKKLSHGENVWIKSDTVGFSKQSDPRESINCEASFDWATYSAAA